MLLKILFYYFKSRFLFPSIFANQSNFFRRYIPIVSDEFVFTLLPVPIINQSQTKCFFLFLLFIIQVNMLTDKSSSKYFINAK